MSDNKENIEKDDNKDINLYGKVAKFPKNTKAKSALSYLEKIKIPKNKLWYFIIEKEIIDNEQEYRELQTIKYNNKMGFNLKSLVENLKKYYSEHNQEIYNHVKNLKIDGNDKFSVIRNIPNIEVDGKKIINIITEDLIKLLYK